MKHRHVIRGDIFGNDTSYVAGAERFAFDLTPYTWGRLMSMRQTLLAGNLDYGLDICSVTTLAGPTCDIYAGRRSNPCRCVEYLELVVRYDCFYWQFNLGVDNEVYQTAGTLFKYAERIAKKWRTDEDEG